MVSSSSSSEAVEAVLGIVAKGNAILAEISRLAEVLLLVYDVHDWVHSCKRIWSRWYCCVGNIGHWPRAKPYLLIVGEWMRFWWCCRCCSSSGENTTLFPILVLSFLAVVLLYDNGHAESCCQYYDDLWDDHAGGDLSHNFGEYSITYLWPFFGPRYTWAPIYGSDCHKQTHWVTLHWPIS